MMKCALHMGVSVRTLLGAAVATAALLPASATTWYWLRAKSVKDLTGSGYGYARNCADNWQNAETGAKGIPQNGDFIVSKGLGGFGGDFLQPNVFGGLTLTQTQSGEFFSQAQFALQAGGPGLVFEEAVASTGTGNGYLTFTGSGDAIVDIRNPSCRFYVQKSLFGNADITLVKKGPGILRNNEGYAPLNSAKTAYSDARNKFDNYYQHRRFAFGGVRLQEGTLEMSQYYWVSDCDFRFDGDGAVLALKLFDKNNGKDMGVHSLELRNCRLRETANVTGTDHQVSGDDARCYIHMFGTLSDDAFSGKFTNYAGLVWDPENDAEFRFRKAVSPTAGILAVSNGTLRVSEGASFPNVSAISVSGAGARFRVDRGAVAVFPKAALAIANGGRLHLETLTAFKSVTVDGVAPAAGVYCGPDGTVKNAACTVVDWIEGEGHLVLGALPAEASATAATWNGTGNASELANWSGATELPSLADGGLQVAVAGGSSFVADADAWVKGFAFNAAGAFALSAADGKRLWIGSEGLANSANAALAVDNVVVAGPQTWDVGGGSLTVAGPVASLSGALQTIRSRGGKALNLNAATPDWTAPVLVTNMFVNFNVSGALGPKSPHAAYLMGSGAANVRATFANDIAVDRNLWFGWENTITVAAGHDLTFNGTVCSTNTQTLSVKAQEGSTITFNDLFMSRNCCLLSGAGTIVFRGPFHVRDRPSMSETVTVELHVPGNRLNGNLGTFSGGRLRTMAPYVITKENARRQANGTTGNSADGTQNTMINAKGGFVLDLNGFDQALDQLCMHADGTASGGHVTSATPARLRLQTEKVWLHTHNYSYGFSDHGKFGKTGDGYGYETADKGFWEGQVTLSYEAAPGMVRSLMRTSPSSGNVEVASGTLVFLRRAKTEKETFDLKDGAANPYWRLADEDGAWPNAKRVVVTGGVLKLEHGKAFGGDVELDLSSAGKLQLEPGVRLKCAALTLDGETRLSGVFGSTASGAATKLDAFFTGTGVVQVGTPGSVLILR